MILLKNARYLSALQEKERIKPIYDKTYLDSKDLNITLPELITLLIQNTGRFVERYASDLLINLRSLDVYLDHTQYSERKDEDVIMFGLRMDGVDGNSFVLSRLGYDFSSEIDLNGEFKELYKTHSNEYRRLYLLYTTKEECPYVLNDEPTDELRYRRMRLFDVTTSGIYIK